MTRQAFLLLRCVAAGVLLAIAAAILVAGACAVVPLVWMIGKCMPAVEPPKRTEPQGGLAWALDDSTDPDGSAFCESRGDVAATEV